jgi:hypothetical protein
MSDAIETAGPESNVRRLSDAIRDVKNAMADRDDVVVEMREAERARLELLAQELQSVIADAPAEHPAFDFAISAGAQPRFWIDAVAHVSMGRDKRTYRFVRDTRLGRVVLAESTDLKPVADAVTRYVAERIVERQRELEGVRPLDREATAEKTVSFGTERERAGARNRGGEVLSNFALVAVGVLAGVAVTLAYLRDRLPELSNLF